MKTAVLRKFLTATILCLIVVLTMLTVFSVCYAEENAAATETGDGSAVTAPAEGETSGETDGTGDTDVTEDPDASGDDPVVDLHFDPDNVLAALDIMWKGVLAIFITIAIIIIVSVLMNKACNAASASVKKRQAKYEEELRNKDSSDNN